MSVGYAGLATASINASGPSSGSFGLFVPTPGRSYVVGAAAASDGSGTPASITGVQWASGDAFARLGAFQINAFSPEVSLWISTAPGSGIITVTGNVHVNAVFAYCAGFTGVDTAAPAGAHAAGGGLGNFNNLIVTPQSTGGRIIYVAIDIFEGFVPAPNADSTLVDAWNDIGAENWGLVGTSNTAQNVDYTIGITNTVSDSNQIAYELLPAAAPPASAGAALWLMGEQRPTYGVLAR